MTKISRMDDDILRFFEGGMGYGMLWGCIRLTSGFHFVVVIYPVIGGSVPFWWLVKIG